MARLEPEPREARPQHKRVGVVNEFRLGGFSPTHLEKYANVILDHFSKFRDEHQKYLSCHHPKFSFNA